MKEFELWIGRLILAMNRIDFMTYHCYRVLVGKEPLRAWQKERLQRRLAYLIEKVPTDTKIQSKLITLLDEAQNIRSLRNMVAHATIAVDARNPVKPGEPTRFLLTAHGHDPMTLEDLVAVTEKCLQLSNQISECTAAGTFEKWEKIRISSK